jgi:hypothetical protein
MKAIKIDKKDRFSTIEEFFLAWESALIIS